jgi:hypothetical protein
VLKLLDLYGFKVIRYAAVHREAELTVSRRKK